MTGAGDRERVTQLLGRPPQGRFAVVVRDPAGEPLVIRNAPATRRRHAHADPLLAGRPGGAAGRGPAGIRREAYGPPRPRSIPPPWRRPTPPTRAERDAAIPADWTGPRPSGGVGGTRKGVKCLHAHYAWHLAGGDDPVGTLGGRPACSRWRPSTAAPTRPGCSWPAGAEARWSD